MNVHALTSEQKDLLIGQQFAPDSFFNPTQDGNGVWFVSIEEVNKCTNELFMWVKNLPKIEYTPITNQEI